MKKNLKRTAAGFVIVLIAVFGWGYVKVTTLHVVQITDDLSMLQGVGGNVAVLKTDAGTVIVDSMTFSLQGSKIAKLAQSLTGKPVVAVINTHFHSDHTHGNPGFGDGTRIIATSKTHQHLTTDDAEYWEGKAKRFLPSEFVDDWQELQFGDKTLQLLHPGRGHTDGDLVVYFVEENTIHSGDLFFAGHFPNIDLEGGGSVLHWPASLDKVLELPFEHVIPGHGPVSNTTDLRQYRDFFAELAELAQNAADSGETLEDFLTSAKLTQAEDLHPFHIRFLVNFDRDFVLTRAWQEATQADLGEITN